MLGALVALVLAAFEALILGCVICGLYPNLILNALDHRRENYWGVVSVQDAALAMKLYIHGGGWAFGDKRVVTMPICYYLASHGWVVVNMNYRLCPDVKYPTHLIDVKRAMRWIHENIHKFGGDPNFIAVSGGSAGGHLATMAALSQNDLKFQPGFETVPTSIQACVAYYPVVDTIDKPKYMGKKFSEWFLTKICGRPFNDENLQWLQEHSSPLHLLDSYEDKGQDPPPFLILQYGSTCCKVKQLLDHAFHLITDLSLLPFWFKKANDTLVPPKHVKEFVRKYRQVSTKNHMQYIEFPFAHHGFDAFINALQIRSSPKIKPRSNTPKMPQGILKVVVVEAKELNDKDGLGKSDPYVQLWVDKKYVKQTTVKKDSLTPVWNEEFTFAVEDGQKYLYIRVLDKDFVHSDTMGEAKFDLSGVFSSGKVDEWVKLPELMGIADKGSVHLKMTFTKA
ncbi:hypothetical protein HK102_006440 [Quaeritorhiza haematococci]|nr:hypothetical protein HK102_006440 [Quaeritorhiza haematococci]